MKSNKYQAARILFRVGEISDEVMDDAAKLFEHLQLKDALKNPSTRIQQTGDNYKVSSKDLSSLSLDNMAFVNQLPTFSSFSYDKKDASFVFLFKTPIADEAVTDLIADQVLT